MPTYLMFSTLSPQGLQTLRVTPERLLEVNREIEAAGVKVHSILSIRVTTTSTICAFATNSTIRSSCAAASRT